MDKTKREIKEGATAHALRVLEFGRIREVLAGFCDSAMGRDRAMALSPLDDVGWIRRRLELIDEIVSALAESGQPDLTGISNQRKAVETAKKKGILSAEKIWRIGLIAAIGNRLAIYYRKGCADKPRLAEMLSVVEEIPDLDRRVGEYILPPGEINEDATPLLTKLRKRKSAVHERLQSRLESYLSDKRYSKYLQDELITLRNGRFVLPVKVESKQEIAGVIHDRSSSGATLFIEPLPVVEMNNELREIELAEKAERERILRLLTEIISVYSDALLSNIALFGRLDFLVACARWSRKFGCTKPIYGESKDLKLVAARHPLLLLETEHDADLVVVPLDLDIPADRRALVITGPNMGGKTVALKTVGLLSAIARCGIPIPAAEGTSIPHFSAIFADIGDEQSIDNSLSSFAAHVVRWKEAVIAADDRSLVLIDEIGSATDPEEGTPLSRVILEELVDRGAYLLVTTHLGGLKTLAGAMPGVENGAMEFDEERLEPTYILRTGAPGRSWAFQIARRLGFPENILKKGEALIGEGGSQVDRLISELQRKRNEADELKRKVSNRLRDLESDRETLNELIVANRKKAAYVEELRKRFEDDRLDMLERELAAEKRKINAELKGYRQMEKAAEAAREYVRKKIEEVKGSQRERRGKPIDVRKGDRVWLYRLKKHGNVLRGTDKHGYILVEVGGVKLRIHGSAAMPPKEETSHSRRGEIRYERPKVPIARDVRGMTFEEAWKIVDSWISDALVVGMPRLTLIHGKGTGALREKLRKRVEKDKRIKKWEFAEASEGGDGATILFVDVKNK
ncbi:Smr/MutS family protein [bacterium]|nr:Smr/MutS family protein [bacterium]